MSENDATPELIYIEVAYAERSQQWLEGLHVPRGSTVDDAVSIAFEGKLNEDKRRGSQAGIWGRPVDRSRVLKNGDRVELYRELLIDPRADRRERAAAGQSMGAQPAAKGRD